jgi:hypothetical protein
MEVFCLSRVVRRVRQVCPGHRRHSGRSCVRSPEPSPAVLDPLSLVVARLPPEDRDLLRGGLPEHRGRDARQRIAAGAKPRIDEVAVTAGQATDEEEPGGGTLVRARERSRSSTRSRQPSAQGLMPCTCLISVGSSFISSNTVVRAPTRDCAGVSPPAYAMTCMSAARAACTP